MASQDANDPFLTHNPKGGIFPSLWSQPSKKPAPPPGPYKADAPPEITPMQLFVFPMVFFIITALSFTLFWELNKAVPIVIACIMLSTVFDKSAGGGEDSDGLLPSLGGRNFPRAVRVWLRIVVTWLAVFLGGVNGMNAEESYMSQFYAITFFSAYENVLASTPGAAYSDAGKVWFAKSSKLDVDKSIGFKEKLVYCAAPIIDENQGPKSIAFWAIGYDCCDARGGFKCGDLSKVRGGVRAPPDGFFAQDNGMFLKAVDLSAAVNNLDVDKDVILLHWVEDPDAEARSKFLTAMGADLIGAALFALLVVVMNLIGFQAEHEARPKKPPAPVDTP